MLASVVTSRTVIPLSPERTLPREVWPHLLRTLFGMLRGLGSLLHIIFRSRRRHLWPQRRILHVRCASATFSRSELDRGGIAGRSSLARWLGAWYRWRPDRRCGHQRACLFGVRVGTGLWLWLRLRFRLRHGYYVGRTLTTMHTTPLWLGQRLRHHHLLLGARLLWLPLSSGRSPCPCLLPRFLSSRSAPLAPSPPVRGSELRTRKAALRTEAAFSMRVPPKHQSARMTNRSSIPPTHTKYRMIGIRPPPERRGKERWVVEHQNAAGRPS